MTPPSPPSATDPSRSAAWVGAQARLPRIALGPITRFRDSDDFLLSPSPHRFAAYLVEAEQAGVRAIDLLRLIRRRSDAPLLLLSPQPARDFVAGLKAGADMVLPVESPAAHLDAALEAIGARVRRAGASPGAWVLQESRHLLTSPQGSEIPLTDTDVTILAALADSEGKPVPREALMQRLWGDNGPGSANALHATVYRLRKRLEQGGRALSPLQAVSRVGYEFKEALVRG